MAHMRGGPTDWITGVEIMAMVRTTSIGIRKITVVATIVGVTIGTTVVGIPIGRERLEPS